MFFYLNFHRHTGIKAWVLPLVNIQNFRLRGGYMQFWARLGSVVVLALAVAMPYAAKADDTAFLVQLGSFPTEDAAKSAWADLQKENPSLQGLTDRITDIAGPSGTMYRLQAGSFNERVKAEQLCSGLVGKTAQCFVVETALFVPSPQPSLSLANAAPADKTATNAKNIAKDAENKESANDAANTGLSALAPLPSALPNGAATAAPAVSAPVLSVASTERPASDTAGASAANAASAEAKPIAAKPAEAKEEPGLFGKVFSFFTPSEDVPAPAPAAPAATETLVAAQPSDTPVNNVVASDIAPPAPSAAPQLPTPAPIVAETPAPLTLPPTESTAAAAIATTPVAPIAPPAAAEKPIKLAEQPALSKPMITPPEPAAVARAPLNKPSLAKPAALADAPKSLVAPATLKPPVAKAPRARDIARDARNKSPEVNVAEAVRVPVSGRDANALRPLPSAAAPVNSGKTLWAQISFFPDEATALGYWDSVRGEYPEIARATQVTRVVRPLTRGLESQLSLRVGPFATADALRQVCDIAFGDGLRCTAARDVPTLRNENRPRLAPARGYHASTASIGGGTSSSLTANTWIQLGTYNSADDAAAAWQILQREHGELLARQREDVTPAPGAENLFRLRVGPFARGASANGLCQGLMARGVECLVVTGN